MTTTLPTKYQGLRIAFDLAEDFGVANLIASADVEDIYRTLAESLGVEVRFGVGADVAHDFQAGQDDDLRREAWDYIHCGVAVHTIDDLECARSIIAGYGITNAEDVTDEMLSTCYDAQHGRIIGIIEDELAKR